MSDKHILYTSCLCSKRIENEILKTNPKGIGLQVQKYHRLLAKGFVRNGLIVDVLCYHKSINDKHLNKYREESENGIDYTYITTEKSGHLDVLKKSYEFADRYFKSFKDAHMICDVLNFTVSLGAALAARKHRRKIVGIITDFPEQLSGKHSIYSRMVWMLVSLCTDYVVLTEQMKERLDPKRSAIVLEGHVDSDMSGSDILPEEKYKKKVCIYAGMLHRKYGIERLVKAFINADVEDAELHIYGDGDYAEELRKIDSKFIKYYGIVPNNKVIEEEMKASLLINPRPTDEEFTKYSFPSKNLEYMASGTPLLTTRLPGMPEEYLEHVFTFKDESIEGMEKTLKEVLSLSGEELLSKGREAKTFVLEHKTETKQARKIIEAFI